MPKGTTEFTRYWRVPGNEPDLEAQNARLTEVINAANQDQVTARQALEMMIDKVKNFDANYDEGETVSRVAMLQTQNMMMRVNLLQLLAYFEGVNTINANLQYPLHDFTQTPVAIRNALES